MTVLLVAMMHHSHHILLLGRDALLLRLRGSILGKDGFAVDAVGDLRELMSCLTGKPYKLLILCHSLSSAERNAAVALTLSIQPELEVLALGDHSPASPAWSPVHLLARNAGPEKLRDTARQLMNSNGKASPGAERVQVAQPGVTARWFNHALGYEVLGRDGVSGDSLVNSASPQAVFCTGKKRKSLKNSEPATEEW